MLAEMDVVMLSRIQFALTIMFHYPLPPLTIGLGIIIAHLEGMSLWKNDQSYMDALVSMFTLIEKVWNSVCVVVLKYYLSRRTLRCFDVSEPHLFNGFRVIPDL